MCVIMSLVEESEVQDDKIKKPAEKQGHEFAALEHTVENLLQALHLTHEKKRKLTCVRGRKSPTSFFTNKKTRRVPGKTAPGASRRSC